MDANGTRMAGLVHCALVRPESSGGFRPALATAWRRSGDLAWEFDLDPGARFQDGTTVTAADVAATYRSMLAEGSASPRRAALSSVRQVEAMGLGRVRFVLSAPDASFLEGATIGVLPERLAAEPGPIDPARLVGCGPFRLASSSADAWSLVAATTWPDKAPTLAAVDFVVVPDAVMRALLLRSGGLDLVQNALEPDAVRAIAKDAPSLRVVVTPYDAEQYLGLNHRQPALADVLVRRAIAHAIDREGIIRNLLGGAAEPASGMLPPQHGDHAARVRRYAHDPTAARRLLDRAGLVDPDGTGPLPRLRLRLATSTEPLRRRIAEAIAANLDEVGIEVSIASWEWGTFFADVNRGNTDLYSLAWIGIHDADLLRTVNHSGMAPPAGLNRGGYANARMDRVTDAARAEQDPARRRVLLARAQRIAARTLPAIPLWWPRNVVVLSARVRGFEPSSSGDLGSLARASLAPAEEGSAP